MPRPLPSNHMTPVERDQAVRLYRGGMTLDRLAEVFDRERTTVYRLVKRNGPLCIAWSTQLLPLTSTGMGVG